MDRSSRVTAVRELSNGQTPPEKLEDEDLLEAMARGSQAALSVLYDRFSTPTFALALRMLRDTATAEEVLQEVFLYAWRRAAAYDRSRSSPLTWLILITRSRCLDRLRKRTKRRQAYASYQRERSAVSAAGEGFDPAVASERGRRIWKALEALPEEQRQVIEMCYYGGLTQREVAEATESPLGTVKTRSYLAIRKLRGALEPDIAQLI